IEKPKRIFPQVQTALNVSCFTPVFSGERTGTEALSGKGVYVAVIDSGIDYTLPVFRNADGTTRIDFLWDQGKVADSALLEAPPEGFAVGVEYTGAQINENLAQGPGAPRLTVDVTGHGTAVSSIIAQAAPESRFIIVKLDVANQASYPSTTSLLRALTYVVKLAVREGHPVAVNLSYGNTYGPHDGTSLTERFLDNLSEIGRNVICVGSGNEGASAGHFSKTIMNEERIAFTVGDYEATLSLQIWKNYADRYSIEMISPAGETYVIRRVEEVQDVVLEQTRLLIFGGGPQPYRTKEEIYIDFQPLGNYIDRGVWQIKMTPQKIVNGRVQMYMPSEVVRSGGTRFLLPNPDATLTIPSTAQKVITVGAYQTLFGAYADFSGRGYAMNAVNIGEGLAKPDIVAPGVGIRVQGTQGPETVSGTSYATPFVTAASALMMEWGIEKGNDAYLYGEKVKAYLIAGARQLRGFESWPNDMAGWGALCLADSIPGYGG
nr:S8 family peptidase [Lachnospiraceae bacterium]